MGLLDRLFGMPRGLGAFETLHNAAAAPGTGTDLDVLGFSGAVIQVTGTFTGLTLTFKASMDGVNFFNVEATNYTDSSKSATASTSGIYFVRTLACKSVRVEISAIASGSVTVKGRGATELLMPSEATLQNTVFSDYTILLLDLGTARTDIVVASNVVAIAFVDATAGSTYSIKFFDAAHDGLDEVVFAKISPINDMVAGNVLVSNVSQAGKTLRLAVLKRS